VSITIRLKISDRDIRDLRKAMLRARDMVSHADEDDIVDAARSVMGHADLRHAPDFIRDRIPRLSALIDMIEDNDWQLPSRQRQQILAALVYFSDPEDLIPDDVPALGFLDDAIIAELVLLELRHVIEAYEDFCQYRDDLPEALATDERGARLEKRRWALHGRMKRRTKSDRAGLPDKPIV
jgi:uncharacterized membrane protein YkvA (DUF1232 family)